MAEDHGLASSFTQDGYMALVNGLLARGYRTASFHDADADRADLVLRHDVDQSIAAASTIAALEATQGWRSTWFILLRTEMYNPFSRDATAALRTMAAHGHEIGLHLDATHYGDAAALEAGAGTECRMLEDIVCAPVRIVSFHRPAPEFLGSDRPLSGRPHTYMPRFTQAMGYCSDSRGTWRHGHPFDHAAVAQRRALHLLTHAVWWVGPRGRDRVGRLRDVLADATARLDRELADNNDVWRRASEESEL